MTHPIPLESFCSVLSMEGDEPLAGTAMTASQYIFISWPKIFWARKQFDSELFPETLSKFLQDLQKEKRIFTRLAYRNANDSRKHSQIFIMPDGVTYRNVPFPDIEGVLRNYFSGIPDQEHQRTFTNGSYIFCCTHGKRDNCCAKFGQSVLYELERESVERGIDLQVWECTHIGADRFAAIAVVFPQCFMYGRLRADNIRHVMDYLTKGYPYPPCYRGRLGLDTIAQTAEAFGHFHWFQNGLENAAVTVDSAEQISPDISQAYVTISDKSSGRVYAKFALQLTKQLFPTYRDCDGVAAGELKKASRWVVSESRVI